MIKDIANKVRQIQGIAGEPTVTHRNRPLTLSGSISSNLIRAGNKFSMDFSWKPKQSQVLHEAVDSRTCDLAVWALKWQP